MPEEGFRLKRFNNGAQAKRSDLFTNLSAESWSTIGQLVERRQIAIDIVTPLTKKIAAVQVDARSGKVLSKLVQTPSDRAEESVGAQKKK
jgi:hypothetical protein